MSPEPAGYRIAYSAGRYFRVDWFHLRVFRGLLAGERKKDNHGNRTNQENEHTKVQERLTSCRRSMFLQPLSDQRPKLATARPSH